MKPLRHSPALCTNYEKRTNAGAALSSPRLCNSTEGLCPMSPPQIRPLGRGAKFTQHHLGMGGVFYQSRNNCDYSHTNFSERWQSATRSPWNSPHKMIHQQDDSACPQKTSHPARNLRQGWFQIHLFLLSPSLTLSTRGGGEPLSKLATGSTAEGRRT